MNLLRLLCAAAVAGLGAGGALADDGCCKPNCCAAQPCATVCRVLTCRPEVKTVKVSKSCFKTDCKDICIPAVTFPWQVSKQTSCGNCLEPACEQKCFQPKCGKVITVRVLDSEDYDVEECACEWKIEETFVEQVCKPRCCESPAPACCALQAPADPLVIPVEPEVAPLPPTASTRRRPTWNSKLR